MHHKGDILAITNAIKYFQLPLEQPISHKQLQTNLVALSSMLEQQQIQVGFVSDMLSLLTKRYYELSGRKSNKVGEEYVWVRFVEVVGKFYRAVGSRGGQLSKDQIIILMSATLNYSKAVFQEHAQKMPDLRGALLEFNHTLISDLIGRPDFRVEEIYPKQYSLCSNIIKNDKISLKEFGLCMNTLTLLVKNNLVLRDNNENNRFVSECLKRLRGDVIYLTDVLCKYEIAFRIKAVPFCCILLEIFQEGGEKCVKVDFSSLIQKQQNNEEIRRQIFGKVVLMAQISQIDIKPENMNFYQKTIIEESYRQLYISSAKSIRKLDVNIQSKKRQFKKLNYLNSFIKISTDQNDQLFTTTIDLLQHIFTISKNHNLITIPFHATTIPLQKLQTFHSEVSYPNKGLDEEYFREFARVLAEIMPFFELEPTIVSTVGQFFASICQNNRNRLLEYFSDELLKHEYSLNMSVTRLFSHIQQLCIINFLLRTNKKISNHTVLNTIFTILANKSQSVKSLRASYIQEQLLIALSIELIKQCYISMKNCQIQNSVKNRIKQTQNTIILVQKILNSIGQSSYIIRLSCTLSIFAFTSNLTLQESFKPIQTTIVSRNKNNLQLILTLLELTTMNQLDYQQLAQYYMNHKGAEPILRYLLPKISTQLGRKCILTVERWWLILNKEVIEWLNCKQMNKTEDKAQNFAVQDGQNVVIKNALGVIIIELGQRWIYYLRSQKREAIIDILIELARTNAQMVFFKRNFSKIIKQLHRILLQTLGQQEFEVTCIKNKNKNKSSQNKNRVIEPTKVEFYNRLRHKIYFLLTLIPNFNYTIYDRQIFQPFRQLLLETYQKIKRSYLFEGDASQKNDYDFLKPVVALLQ